MLSRKIAIVAAALLTVTTPALARHVHHHGKSLRPLAPQNGHSVNGPASGGAGTGENRPSASGGQPGGPASQN